MDGQLKKNTGNAITPIGKNGVCHLMNLLSLTLSAFIENKVSLPMNYLLPLNWHQYQWII